VFVCRHLRSCPKSPFLSEITAADGGLDVGRLTAGEVGRFVLGECATRSVGSAKNVVMALRSLLRFLYLEGVIAGDLAGSIPAVAPQPRSLPRALDPRLVARLLASCDRRTGTGRRDFAVLTVLARLGLRAGEVAAAGLGDIDWLGGDMLVRGKGGRRDRLPLPVDVGEVWPTTCNAAAPGLPARGCSCACTRQPGGLSGGGVSGIVHAACGRCGLPAVGAHRLRHTAATETLRAGGSPPDAAYPTPSAGRDDVARIRTGGRRHSPSRREPQWRPPARPRWAR